jgi:predicted alpha-1,6-mannanase (GH76 family)
LKKNKAPFFEELNYRDIHWPDLKPEKDLKIFTYFWSVILIGISQDKGTKQRSSRSSKNSRTVLKFTSFEYLAARSQSEDRELQHQPCKNLQRQEHPT